MFCPCGSGHAFEACCAPILDGRAAAPTAEALMRSRYSAFVRGAIDHLLLTHDPATRGSVTRASIEAWSRSARWQGLEVLQTERGGADDEEGVVEFRARYSEGGASRVHHERSRFRRIDGNWYYVDGEAPAPASSAPVVRGDKIGRNDPCPCGSGRKYKKCCG
jgi:SEC-C motif-containing protein